MKKVKLLFLIAGSLVFLTGCAADPTFQNTPCTGTVYLAQLGLNSKVSGNISMFLGIGSGSISSNMVYYYFAINPDNSKELRHTAANDQVHVFEDSPSVPYVCSHGTVDNDIGVSWLIEFHIPKGSIAQDYTLNAH